MVNTNHFIHFFIHFLNFFYSFFYSFFTLNLWKVNFANGFDILLKPLKTK